MCIRDRPIVEDPPRKTAVKHPNNINTPKLLSASIYFLEDLALTTPKIPIEINKTK